VKRIRIFLSAIALVWAGTLAGQNRALLIIDIQDFYFPGGAVPLENVEAAAESADRLLQYFRTGGEQVVHVRHNFEPGGGIYTLLKPEKSEPVITKEHVNAFLDTGLDSLMRAHKISELVICGMQTHMCLEAAARAAADLGYQCTVVADACATRDLTWNDRVVPAELVHLSTLATLRSYVTVVSLAEFLKQD